MNRKISAVGSALAPSQQRASHLLAFPKPRSMGEAERSYRLVQGGAFLNERACELDWLASYEARILTLIQAMGANAGRVVIARVPYPMGRRRHSDVLYRVDCFDAMLERAAEAARAPMLDLMAHLCATRACIAESEGQPIRPDGLHFDGAGAEETARWAIRELQRVAR